MRAIDHLVVTAPSLAAGVAWVEATLGVPMQAGGEHVRMGTHNALLSLGPGVYLEVIAVNPAAPPPAHPRWFGLDALAPDAAPRLATWVLRTDDIAADVAAFAISPGAVMPMARGDFRWQISVPADGRLVADGVQPTLIQWADARHPADSLADVGCRLLRLVCAHPQAGALQAPLARLGLDACLEWQTLMPGQTPCLSAELDTPAGRVTLGGTEQ
ncbi:VOC family protein [Denitromonas iodatirespirans]|uniref:VOC family protein n=1 Tax=Denitromonas iodatirespirans TaxID=2795389 RepID=A0A944DB57_DENI1|nr:VOC family protein [Denitromonas iodatirespirans]MBT0963284.1 VOC family protein [Denitromonas iodatirespirans]